MHGLIRRWLAPFALVMVVAAGIALVFLDIYLSGHAHVPIGWDTPSYIWRSTIVAARGAAGLPSWVPPPSQTNPARLGYPVIALELASLTGASPFTVAAVLPAVLAAVIGLAFGAFAGVALRRSGWEIAFIAFAMGASPFVARMVGPESYQDNLLFAAVLGAGLTALTIGLRERRALIAAVLLFAAGAVIHWEFFSTMLGVLGATAAVLALPLVRSWRQGRRPAAQAPALRIAAALAAATALSAAVVYGVLTASLLSPTLDTSEFGEKLDAYLGTYHLSLVVPLAAIGLGLLLWRRRLYAPAGTFAVVLLAVWSILPAVGYVGFRLGLPVPVDRLIAAGLGLPLLAALAAVAIIGLVARRSRRAAAVLAIAALAAVADSTHAHWETTRAVMSQGSLTAGQIAGDYLASLHVPPTRPVVFIVDNPNYTDQSAAAWLDAHMLRAGLPADWIGRSYIYVGSPTNFLAGRPTRAALRDPQPLVSDQLSGWYFRQLRPALSQNPIAILLRPYNRTFFSYWAGLHPKELAGPRIAIVRGPVPAQPLPPSTRLHGTLSPLPLLGTAVAAFLLLLAAGLPWVRLCLGGSLTRLQALATAPAAGIAAVVLIGIAASRMHAPLGGHGGAAVAVGTLVLGAVAAGIRRPHRRPAPAPRPGEPPALAPAPANELVDR
jgi:hypothetical protein